MWNVTPDSRHARTVIVLITLTGTAFFVATGTSQLIASALLDVPAELGAGGLHGGIGSARHRAEAAGAAILERNIFDSATGPLDWRGARPGPPPPPPPLTSLSQDHPPCDGSTRLVGTYVWHGDLDQSFAAVMHATGTSLLYRVGMAIAERPVLRIERERVVLGSGGALCDLTMFGPPPPAAVVPDMLPASAEAGVVETAELDASIHQVSDTSYAIHRALVDRLLAHQGALLTLARVIPHEEDGRTVGMKLYGIRRSSVLGRLGVQNGDMVRTINGVDLTDPSAILQAYAQLRAADHVTLHLVRRGSPVSLDYQIQ